ncbi:electron transport complex subunit RsxC [Celerinatantimonas sp. YJH-8]|uniref:electron transport complex subunit RsxC n=1 Tax=Celerinatantimonas sp. YJH-8 TaxID=3228714 RepID=UPI0038C586BA
MTLKNIQAIREGKIWSFQGGVHPYSHKKKVSTKYPKHFEYQGQYILHPHQHIGEDGDIVVHIGERVLGGQPLTQSALFSAPPIHAPTSGIITAIEKRPTNHPSAIPETAIILQPDAKDEWLELEPIQNTNDRMALVNAIHQAGICGLGGAGFPTAIKIASRSKTNLLIVNGAECEPYITADDTLMQHYAQEIKQGIKWIQQITKPTLTIIAIENDKPKAIQAMQKVSDENTIVRAIPAKYPSGGKKQLIEILTGQQVPSGGLSADVGILMLNVGTIYAVHRAIDCGEPLTRRMITLAGKGMTKQQNMWIDIGTPISSLLPEKSINDPYLIMGGPMMGYALPSAQIPIIKTSNCVLYGNKAEFGQSSQPLACIRCGECAEACPIDLLPQQLYWFIQGNELEKAKQYALKDCIECGACAYVCPSHIPLVQYYRQGKAQLREQRQLELDAERARQRTERRNQRLEREKEEREARHQQAAQQRAKELQDPEKTDAIAAAIARVKAKQAGTQQTPTTDSTQEDARKAATVAAVARARAKKAEQQPTPEDASRKDAVTAAVARAKAKKAEQSSTAEDDPRKAAVAAAVARAKAKKAEQSSTADDDPRKAAVSAAVARAKAKKAEQSSIAEDDPRKAAVAAAVARAKAKKAEQSSTAEDDPRKAAVAAAVARAKAKKAEQSSTADDDPRKAAVAAAVARAKAKKAEQSSTADDDPRKAAVAAAVARAKAKKAAQRFDASSKNDEESPNS